MFTSNVRQTIYDSAMCSSECDRLSQFSWLLSALWNLIQRASDWLYKNSEVQVRSCETITWMSHDAKRLGDCSEQMVLTQSIEDSGTTSCVRGLRLWLTPSVGGKPESLSCYDFAPTGTNDLRSLVAKVNRKLSRNQLKGWLMRVETVAVPESRRGQVVTDVTRWTESSDEDKLYTFILRVYTTSRTNENNALKHTCLDIKDFIPSPLEGDIYEGFETLVEKANSWLEELSGLVHVSLQSVLVQQGDRPHTELGNSCQYSVPGVNSDSQMDVFRILRVVFVKSTSAVSSASPRESAACCPLSYEVFSPEQVRLTSTASAAAPLVVREPAEKMRDTFAKMASYLRNAGVEIISVETIMNPIQVTDDDNNRSPDVVTFQLSLRLFVTGSRQASSSSRVVKRTSVSRSTEGGDEAQDGTVGGAPLFLGSIVSRRFKYRWLVLALFGFSGMAVIVALSVVYSNK